MPLSSFSRENRLLLSYIQFLFDDVSDMESSDDTGLMDFRFCSCYNSVLLDSFDLFIYFFFTFCHLSFFLLVSKFSFYEYSLGWEFFLFVHHRVFAPYK